MFVDISLSQNKVRTQRDFGMLNNFTEIMDNLQAAISIC